MKDGKSGALGALVIDAALPMAEQIETTAIGMLLVLRDHVTALTARVAELAGQNVERASLGPTLSQLEQTLVATTPSAVPPETGVVVVVDLGTGGLWAGRVLAIDAPSITVDCGIRGGVHTVTLDRVAPAPRSCGG